MQPARKLLSLLLLILMGTELTQVCASNAIFLPRDPGAAGSAGASCPAPSPWVGTGPATRLRRAGGRGGVQADPSPCAAVPRTCRTPSPRPAGLQCPLSSDSGPSSSC